MRTLFVLGVLLVAVPAHAQTPTVQFNQGNVASAAQAQSFTYRLYVTPAGGTTPGPAVVLTTVTCTGSAAPFACTAPLPGNAQNALVTGARSAVTAAETSTATESAPSVPFSSPASVPTGLSITSPGTRSGAKN